MIIVLILTLSLPHLSVHSSTRYQCPGGWKHRSGHAQFLLHLPPPDHLPLQKLLHICGHAFFPTQPPTTAHQAQFHSRCPAQRAAPSETARVLQPGHFSACCFLPALRLLCVPLQGPHGKQERGAACPEGWETWIGWKFVCGCWVKLMIYCNSLSFSPFTDTADATERHSFLGFASFLSQLGPHPFLPELLGVVSLRAPLVTVVEELENRDMLSFLWRCRQVYRDDVFTQKRAFIKKQNNYCFILQMPK